MSRAVRILLVEDDQEAVILMRQALKDATEASELFVVGDGEEALDFVFQRGDHADAPRPDLVILDLNLPRRSGHEVLECLKENPDTRRIPVVILTTSIAEPDIESAYEHRANAYVRKPMHYDDLVECVASLEEFWLGVSTLPPR